MVHVNVSNTSKSKDCLLALQLPTENLKRFTGLAGLDGLARLEGLEELPRLAKFEGMAILSGLEGLQVN